VLVAPGTVVVDPDAIARRRGHNAIRAGREAIRVVTQALERGVDLLVETTFAGRYGLQLMERARSRGYTILFLYVGTTDVGVNLRRIRARVARGGHDVPAEDVVRRYTRSIANLAEGLRLADEAGVFDNSTDGVGPTLVAQAVAGKFDLVAAEVPRWVVTALQR
jgi:predicted ABC-type ATPase